MVISKLNFQSKKQSSSPPHQPQPFLINSNVDKAKVVKTKSTSRSPQSNTNNPNPVKSLHHRQNSKVKAPNNNNYSPKEQFVLPHMKQLAKNAVETNKKHSTNKSNSKNDSNEHPSKKSAQRSLLGLNLDLVRKNNFSPPLVQIHSRKM